MGNILSQDEVDSLLDGITEGRVNAETAGEAAGERPCFRLILLFLMW